MSTNAVILETTVVPIELYTFKLKKKEKKNKKKRNFLYNFCIHNLKI